MEKSLKSSATNYGLYLGLALAAINVIAYVVNVELFNSWMVGTSIFIVIVVLGIIAANASKKILGGFISFKKAFTSYFITVALGLLISSIVYYVLFSIVDTEAAQMLKEMQIENQISMMEKFGAPQDAINEAIVKLEENDPFSIGNQFLGYAIFLTIMSLIGLVVAAIVKRKDPNEA